MNTHGCTHKGYQAGCAIFSCVSGLLVGLGFLQVVNFVGRLFGGGKG